MGILISLHSVSSVVDSTSKQLICKLYFNCGLLACLFHTDTLYALFIWILDVFLDLGSVLKGKDSCESFDSSFLICLF